MRSLDSGVVIDGLFVLYAELVVLERAVVLMHVVGYLNRTRNIFGASAKIFSTSGSNT
jgi:hypothetical protein